jgi:hypothetical protein
MKPNGKTLLGFAVLSPTYELTSRIDFEERVA